MYTILQVRNLCSQLANGSRVRLTSSYDRKCWQCNVSEIKFYFFYEAIQTARNGGPRLIGTLVGNKCDNRDGALDTRAEVTAEDGEAYAKQLQLAYFETSAVLLIYDSEHINIFPL